MRTLIRGHKKLITFGGLSTKRRAEKVEKMTMVQIQVQVFFLIKTMYGRYFFYYVEECYDTTPNKSQN